MHKIVISVWIYMFACFSVGCGLTCICGNVQEGQILECQCDSVNPITWFKGETKIATCVNSVCIPRPPVSEYEFSHTGSTYTIGIVTFSFNSCKTYTARDYTANESVVFPYCPVLTMTKPDTNGPINIVENSTAEFICEIRSSYPSGTVQWYGDSGTPSDVDDDAEITLGITVSSAQSPTDNQEYITTSTLMFSPSRSYTDIRIYCRGTNKPEQTHLTSQRKPLLNILYPPSMLNFYYNSLSGQLITSKSIDVIKGDTFSIGCKSMNGEPKPTIKWSGQTSGNPLLSVPQIQESQTRKTCTATNQMVNSGSSYIEQGVTSDDISFNILIPPTISECTFYNNKTNRVINNPKNLMVLEGQSFSLTCGATGKPSPDPLWNVPSSTSPSWSVAVNNVTRQKRRIYMFYASSVMKPSFQPIKTITANETLQIDILYRPVVDVMNDIFKTKGSKLQVNCPVTNGFPAETTTTWTRDIDSSTWENKQLIIASITKADAGIYTCITSNTMRPSGDTHSYPGVDKKHFVLTVLYEASVTSFYVDGFKGNGEVTVKESIPVMFKCTADSIPKASITMKHREESILSNTSNTLIYSLPKASCPDAGTYSCSAKNVYNKEVSLKTVDLFVNCIPRSADIVHLNRTSETNETFTFTFNAIAYPVPVFIWKKWVGDGWKIVQNDTNVHITYSVLQSNLTILRVNKVDFGKYLLVVRNDVGELELTYQIEPFDEPESPTNFVHIEHLATESSIQLEWNPGFNGGPPQTFYIKYKKSLRGTWTFVSVPDNGDHTMRYMLNGLESDSQYQLLIYSSNIKGNSSESELLIAKTKGNIKSNPAPIIGGVVGGLVIFAAIVAVTIFIVRRYQIRKGIPRSEANKATIRSQYDTNKSSDDVDYYNIGREVQVDSQSTCEPTYYNDRRHSKR